MERGLGEVNPKQGGYLCNEWQNIHPWEQETVSREASCILEAVTTGEFEDRAAECWDTFYSVYKKKVLQRVHRVRSSSGTISRVTLVSND